MVSNIPIQYIYFSNGSIWPMNGTLTGTTTPGPSGPRSNGNEGVHLPPRPSKKKKKWSLKNRCSLVSYPAPVFFRGEGVLTPL